MFAVLVASCGYRLSAADRLGEAALQAGGSDNISVLVVDMRAECPSDAGWHAGKLGDDEDIDDALEGTLHTLRAVSSWRW